MLEENCIFLRRGLGTPMLEYYRLESGIASCFARMWCVPTSGLETHMVTWGRV